MKRIKAQLFIILLAMFIPCIVNAKEYCKVVSGNGKDIGSEIACGTEHFYIVDSNENEIKMLAKYNLYTGITIYKDKLENGQSCEELALSKGGTVKSDAFYDEPGYCFYTIANNNALEGSLLIEKGPEDSRTDYEYCSEEINRQKKAVIYINNYIFQNLDGKKYCTYRYFEHEILQDESAKSAHWDENLNYMYPQVGDIYIKPILSFYTLHDTPVQENSNFYDYDIISGYDEIEEANNDLKTIIDVYKSQLDKNGYSINSINLLSISELDGIINKISKKSLPLKEWGDNLEIIQGYYENSGVEYGTEIHFGDLKPYIPDNYKWLYSTTYWNSTVYKLPKTGSVATIPRFYTFTAEQGKLCGAGFAECAPQTALGCGIRPVIAIPNELQYLIKTKTDGNGTIEVIENSLGGEEIQFKITANEDYKLKKIVITTDSGDAIEFEEGEIIQNDDGTVSIDKNKFTMPFENVTIEAKWGLITDLLENPYTGNILFIMTLILVFTLGIGKVVYKKKESR